MLFLKKLYRYIYLLRLKLLILTASIPLIGGVIADNDLSCKQLFSLFAIGVSAHIFGFGLNDIIDKKLDEKSPLRISSPLVNGKISIKIIWLIVIMQVPFSNYIYLSILDANLIGIILLNLSVILSIVYNVFSKYSKFPKIIAELSLACSVAVILLAGFFAISEAITLKIGLLALCLFLVLHLLNSIPSGLKDLKYDYLNRAKSFIIVWGCKMKNEYEVIISKKIVYYAIFLQVILYIVLIYTAYIFNLKWFNFIFISFFSTLSFLHLYELLQKKDYYEMLTFKPLLSGFYSYLAFLIILVDKIPLFFYLTHIVVFISLIKNIRHDYKFSLKSFKIFFSEKHWKINNKFA